MKEEKLFEEISEAVIEMEDDLVAKLCNRSLELSIPADKTIAKGLVVGMDKVGQLYEENEYFLPEVLTCSDTLNIGLDILKPHVKVDVTANPIKVVIGVVEGDTHDIGKNLVKIMTESAGIEVYDLGRDVPLKSFITVAEEVGANFICMSTLMTTTMMGMKSVIDMLKENNIRDKYKVMIGGGPISQRFADEIGADAYTVDANEAVKRMKLMVAS
ncbi:corrinoid protein [Clostridium algidicarnis]|uniref:Dimethylamine corrinoid protein n=2 Tax=Clostridium algidicarnis TaxID=37659 RepID=A0A2S6FYS5_9CLOT|nr:corrinoid protein [Clostridium algidicarnis]MBB6631464.1 corrinoid protein [Clostridium algidicarnis]MBB6697883.1 corrinoid protein [Clostridium algidicarnis]MBU3193083.1 corrinoid protein [Clostridium algidicarnis]MBU3196270.1 corrinoid protein [Clostridium algidicarnis]MBU3204963.1 corrinoid protein [Clostridium algidicarnis]